MESNIKELDINESNESNEIDNTHNNCTIEKCMYNPENKSSNKLSKYCAGNFCVSCRINLGDCNPRQYCRKTYCPHEN